MKILKILKGVCKLIALWSAEKNSVAKVHPKYVKNWCFEQQIRALQFYLQMPYNHVREIILLDSFY